VLETTAVAGEALPKALADLAGRPHLDEVMVVSTCMRTEVYATTERFHGAVGDIREFLAMWSGTPPEAFSASLYDYYDRAAAGHLLRVASGLDSAVLGEGEILRQVRSAGEAARAERTAGPVLGELVRRAVEAGKRVRSETAIARGTTSLSHTAVMLAGRSLSAGPVSDASVTAGPGAAGPVADDPCSGAGCFAGRRVLVVGAGEMGAALASLVVSADGVTEVLVANRSPARAEAVARSTGATPVAWAEREVLVGSVDAVFCATDAPGSVLTPDAFAARAGRRCVVVDLGVPRNVDPGVAAVAGVELFDLADLQAHADAAVAGRRAEIPAAQAILAEELERWVETSAVRAVAAPVVAALHRKAEAIRVAELERAGARLSGLDPAQRRAVEALTRGIVAKMLHDPTVGLRAVSGEARGGRLAGALVELFDLDV
jgi:glutamyl-tRNA reductase